VAPDKQFQFLTMEEFNRLDRRAKTAYLAQATEKLLEMNTELAAQSLFKDGPPLGGTTLPEKPA
jgi:hypothetical protein